MHKEGELYKQVTVDDVCLQIRYGYYSDEERSHLPPTPIYPNLMACPLFTSEGKPIVAAPQDICEHYLPNPTVSGEEWCNDCRHFRHVDDSLGVCECDARRQSPSGTRQNE